MEPKASLVVRMLRSELIFYVTIAVSVMGFAGQWYAQSLQENNHHNEAMNEIRLINHTIATHLEDTKDEQSEIAELQKFVYALMNKSA